MPPVCSPTARALHDRLGTRRPDRLADHAACSACPAQLQCPEEGLP